MSRYILLTTAITAIAVFAHGTPGPYELMNNEMGGHDFDGRGEFETSVVGEPQVEVRYAPTGLLPSHPMYETLLRANYASGMTPYMVWFIPTRKCTVGFYCRAELIAYQEYDGGKIVVQAGYSIRRFPSKSSRIPRLNRLRIGATKNVEIVRYVHKLMPLLRKTYPSNELCHITTVAARLGFRRAIRKMVSECTRTVNNICEQTATIGTC